MHCASVGCTQTIYAFKLYLQNVARMHTHAPLSIDLHGDITGLEHRYTVYDLRRQIDACTKSTITRCAIIVAFIIV